MFFIIYKDIITKFVFRKKKKREAQIKRIKSRKLMETKRKIKQIKPARGGKKDEQQPGRRKGHPRKKKGWQLERKEEWPLRKDG